MKCVCAPAFDSVTRFQLWWSGAGPMYNLHIRSSNTASLPFSSTALNVITLQSTGRRVII